MKTLTILEGPDNTGKSTLSRILQKNLQDSEYFHLSYSPEIDSYMYEYHLSTWIQALKTAIYKDVIMDRSVVSSLIYQHVYRDSIYNRPELLDLARRIFDTISKSSKIKVVLCLLPEDQWVSQFKKSQELEGKQEMYSLDSRLIEVRNIYESLYKSKEIFGIPIKFEISLHDFLNSPINLTSK